jgi:hypothetical protein
MGTTPDFESWTLDVLADNGVPFRVLVVPTGSCPNHPSARKYYEGSPMVEFYDRRYDHTADGQFICRYNLDTMLERPDAGLCLYGDEPSWTIDYHTMTLIHLWLGCCVARIPITTTPEGNS